MVKRIYITLIVFMCMLPVSAVTVKAESNVIENDETGIPDQELYKEILKVLKKEKGEKFTRKEAEKVESLTISREDNIKTFQGIGYLKNMKKLYCCGIDTRDLEEIAAELPQLRNLTVQGYAPETYVLDIPAAEERKKKLNSLEPLKNMKNLRILDVSENSLTDLNGIWELKKLKTLKAENNQIADLNGIKALTNLTDLDLSKNNLTSVEGIGKLKKLEKLNLSDNHLSNIKGIKKLKKLRELQLDDNHLKKIGEIGQLKNLEILYMRRNQLIGVKGIKNLKNLTYMSLEGNYLTKLGEIKQLKKLKSLNLSANRIKTLTDSDLKNLKNLINLDMCNNELKKLPGKKSLKKLNTAEFSWNYLTKKEIKKKLKKRNWEGYSFSKWMWEEQKTDIKITYISPGQKSNIAKDTTEIVGKIAPAKIQGYTPYFYLVLPDGKTVGLEGAEWTAPKADENGIFRIEGLDLREYAGKDVKLVMLLDYEWNVIIDWFTVQE